MEKVLGIGGVFFRARDPDALAQWYETHLGVSKVPTDAATPPWVTDAGVTIFAPFGADTDYWPAEKQAMVNFRVRDMDAMLAQLRGAGIEIGQEMVMDGIGRFARIHDPEGNPIELWQPQSEV